MADADEDVIPRLGGPAEDVDLSDETQDFRFLASISREDAKIPKRGEKDFEPHATALQFNTLAASRQAMHNALAFQRVHQPKGYTVAIYHPESNMAYSQSPKGPLFTRMGHVRSAKDDPLDEASRGQRLWLLPEEVLYLIERGTVDVRWPVSEDADEIDGYGLPMSLQGAYAVFIGDDSSHGGKLTPERYSVYSALKRAGYTVHRAPSWDEPGPLLTKDEFPPLVQLTWRAGLFGLMSLWTRVCTTFSRSDEDQGTDVALVQPRLYRSYVDIYRRLALINYYDPTAQKAREKDHVPTTDPAFRVTYHVWKPGSTTYKKSAPGIPDFRIAVVNARETGVPDLEQLSSLMDTLPYDPPRDGAQLYQKLKHGYKNVILAIVDQGVTSYLRVADAAFGREKLYERMANGPGAKRGGRRGGRGRGR